MCVNFDSFQIWEKTWNRTDSVFWKWPSSSSQSDFSCFLQESISLRNYTTWENTTQTHTGHNPESYTTWETVNTTQTHTGHKWILHNLREHNTDTHRSQVNPTQPERLWTQHRHTQVTSESYTTPETVNTTQTHTGHKWILHNPRDCEHNTDTQTHDILNVSLRKRVSLEPVNVN